MSRVVFVGNVPYDITEEQLIDVFSAVGPVAGFRLVFDRESGKAKGFGFCEFYDNETAMSAVRNLQGVDVKGRPLRIDLADSDPSLEGKTTNRGEIDGSSSAIPSGVPVPPGTNVMDMITTVIATTPPNQMLDVMAHMKAFVLDSPEKARQLLQSQPQLSYALFQAMLVNRVVDQSVLTRMMAQTSNQSQAAPAASTPAPPPHQHYSAPHNMYQAPPPPQQHSYGHHQQQQHQPQQHYPPPSYQQPPPAPPPAPSYQMPQQSYYGAPPQHQAPVPPPQAMGQQPSEDQKKAMLMQVLSLTPDQIAALQPHERATIQQLRSQFQLN